jgi:uncharacterized membrane protein YdjX (TVP38/TMEM64 family)
LGSFAALFMVVEALHVPLLVDPAPWMEQRTMLAALVGVGLLIVDVVLPVPSSLVMVAHGALFGVLLGTLLSLVGSVGAAMLGFALGRRGGSVLAQLVLPQERIRADRLLERWGALAIVVTRPVPLLAETVAIMAGCSPLGWKRAFAASLVGALPGALLYALTGAAAASVQSGVFVFGAVLVVAAVFWVIGRRLSPVPAPVRSEAS